MTDKENRARRALMALRLATDAEVAADIEKAVFEWVEELMAKIEPEVAPPGQGGGWGHS